MNDHGGSIDLDAVMRHLRAAFAELSPRGIGHLKAAAREIAAEKNIRDASKKSVD